MAEALDIEQRRQRLQQRIEDYQRRAKIVWPVEMEGDWEDDWEDNIELPVESELSDSEEEMEAERNNQTQNDAFAELVQLHMPSRIGLARSRAQGHARAARMEKELRIGQLNDALKNVRVAICRKAVIFREGLRQATGKKQKARSWDHIHAVDGSVRHNAKIYRRGRMSLLRLDVTKEEMDRFRPLKREDLNVNTARIEGGIRGQRDKHLAWFWTIDVASDVEAVDGMTECECVSV